jgi:hypothetical protein
VRRPARNGLNKAMNHNKLFTLLAAVAVIAVGCAPETTSTSGSDEVASNDSGAAGQTLNMGAPVPGARPRANSNSAAPLPPGGPNDPMPATPGGGGGPRGPAGSFAALLTTDQVLEELGLTMEQITIVVQAVPQVARDASDEDRDKAFAEYESLVKTTLKPEQFARLKEIRLQLMGPRALTIPEVSKELGLSQKQVADIEAALDVPRPERPSGDQPEGERPSQEERAKMREELMKAREAASVKAFAVLTAAQQKKLEAMQGAKFVLKPVPGMMPPPPPDGNKSTKA